MNDLQQTVTVVDRLSEGAPNHPNVGQPNPDLTRLMDLKHKRHHGQEAGMAQEQIRIERKSLASKQSAKIRQEVPVDLRTPSGRKLPY
jgi:hypothetical protein